MDNWMIYGATGFTGQLIAEEAVKRGHRPLLAGRSETKLQALASRLGLDYVAASLEDRPALEAALNRVEMVLHIAGPYVFTAEPMLQACLATATHYLDINGEFRILERIFELDGAAREKGIVLMPGVGFDVIATECLARYVADQVPGATELEIAFTSIEAVSQGTTKSGVESLPEGGWVRREGKLVAFPLGEGVREIQFPHRRLTVMAVPWGDLATAYRSTGIPNITAYMSFSPGQIRQIRLWRGVLQNLLRLEVVRRIMQTMVEWTVKGPDEELRETGVSYIRARAADAAGHSAEAWLKTIEAYRLTTLGSLNCVEQILDGSYQGALTPAGAFGADFVLLLPDTIRYDHLPSVPT